MMSSAPSSAAASYRHVIFPDLPGRALRPVDYADDTAATARPAAGPNGGGEVPLSADDRAFLGWLFASSGLDAGRYKPETLKRRLPACLRAVRAATLADARHH